MNFHRFIVIINYFYGVDALIFNGNRIGWSVKDVEQLKAGDIDVISIRDLDKFDISLECANISLFDRNIDLACCAYDKEVLSVIPNSLRDSNDLNADILSMISIMKSIAEKNDKITCRFHAFQNIKCPKWHEDNVKYRLLKTYIGPGTEWVDPSDYMIRMKNFLLSSSDKDLQVNNIDKIQYSQTGDTLIIRGKQAASLNKSPVLHRSPVINNNNNKMRLLLTISIA
mmetsp:Transcript_17745/g.17829  ORF Transcript_17745/g.17829 Transcript_17745/m.17829 type:complete len:227 (+) Transcript_17745:102-782(+)